MEKNKEKSFSFNIIDLLIIALLIAGICAIIYTFVFGNDIKKLFSPKTEISYTVLIDENNTIALGQNVRTELKKDAGTIEELKKSDNGIYVTIKSNAYLVDGELFVNGTKISENNDIILVFDDNSTPEKCTCCKITFEE